MPLILNRAIVLIKIFCSAQHPNTAVTLESVKTFWVHGVYLKVSHFIGTHVSKIARRYRLVRVFVKQRRVWLWAELGTPPLRHYVKAELRLGTVRLQRCSMRTWLSNADATTPLTPVPCLPDATLIASSSSSQKPTEKIWKMKVIGWSLYHTELVGNSIRSLIGDGATLYAPLLATAMLQAAWTALTPAKSSRSIHANHFSIQVAIVWTLAVASLFHASWFASVFILPRSPLAFVSAKPLL